MEKLIIKNSSSKELEELFKPKKPDSISICYYDEDGYLLTHPDDIRDYKKRMRMREKEVWLKNQDKTQQKNTIHQSNKFKYETNDSLWAIADDVRERKEEGEFDTYMDAYRWAEKNISKKGVNITAKKLERAYHKAKSEGKIE